MQILNLPLEIRFNPATNLIQLIPGIILSLLLCLLLLCLNLNLQTLDMVLNIVDVHQKLNRDVPNYKQHLSQFILEVGILPRNTFLFLK